MKQSNKKPHSLYNEILLTAQTFFQDKGFEQTTVLDICDSLEISTSQFCLYFESLDEVLDILWDGGLAIQHILNHQLITTTWKVNGAAATND
jgi:AcrR family transcriptional regulator